MEIILEEKIIMKLREEWVMICKNSGHSFTSARNELIEIIKDMELGDEIYEHEDCGQEPKDNNFRLLICILESDETLVRFQMEFRFKQNTKQFDTLDRMDQMMEELINEGTFNTQEYK